MAWTYLILAGVFELGWPIGIKFAWKDGQFYLIPAILALLSMWASGGFLYLAQRDIPVGTAYAVWTGIGAVGTFVLGVIILGEVANLMRVVSVMFIIFGVIGLKLATSS